ncbi:MAG: peptide MFS transporter [Acidobacteria bacterium]|nr:peptide MFS transporter [Acidobacteriota bacterium]
MSHAPDSGGPDAVSPSAHPLGLSTLFFTEMWERFSYYGMRALLVLFMTDVVAHGGLGMTVVTATALYGLYTFAVYAVALPGGWIADRLTGQRQAVLIGGVIIAVGHLTLAIPTLSAFYLGLALIVVGTGLLKPSVSAMVADLYPEGGARRDAGFSIFYMGINVGALAGPLVCGTLGERVNWHLGFSAAGVGMIFGVVQYVRGWRHLGDAGLLRQQDGDDRVSALRSFWWGTGVVVALVVVVTWLQRSGVFAFSILDVAQATGATIAALVILYFAYIFVFGRLSQDERRRVAVIPVLFVAAAVFWSGYEQTGSSLTLFADGLTNRMVLGLEVPTTWLQSVNPLFIILLAPVVGALWVRLGSKNPSIPAKFTYGLLLLGLGFLVLAWGATFTTDGALVSPMWLVVTYFFHTVGELCLSPVGLSSITKLSPKRLVGQMMGIWFMATALGSLFAGLVAGLVESLALPQLFGAVGLIVIGGGAVMLLASGPVRRLAGDIR